MIQEMAGDIKKFVRENKSLIYFVVLALIVDHVFFKGAFKERLQKMAEKMVAKVEDKIHSLPEAK